jgi:hypothetical protein
LCTGVHIDVICSSIDDGGRRTLNSLEFTVYNAPTAPNLSTEDGGDKTAELSKNVFPSQSTSDTTVIGYYVDDEPIPYRTTVPGRSVTLAQFKRLLSKRGDFRFVRVYWFVTEKLVLDDCAQTISLKMI